MSSTSTVTTTATTATTTDTTSVTAESPTNTSAPSIASTDTHYNDWPNDIGFNTTYQELEPVDLEIKGHIPAYAAGTLFRTGIGPRTVEDKDGSTIFRTNHWFDAFSQVHRFQLHAPSSTSSAPPDPSACIDRATYRSRLTSDGLIERIRREGGPLDDFSFAAKYEPCKSFFQKVQSFFTKDPKREANEVNNAVTLSVNYPGASQDGKPMHSPLEPNSPDGIANLVNKTDAARLQFLDPDTLEPVGIASQAVLHPQLKGQLSGAHAKSCPRTGDVFNYNLDFGGSKAMYRVFRTSASTGETTILATVPHAPAYLHSLFLTENFVVLCIWNSHFTKYGVSVLWEKNILDAMYFNDKAPAAWYVIDRRCPDKEGGRGLVAKFESEPFFAFHSINAFEEVQHESEKDNGDGKTVNILCDIPVYPNTDVLHHLYMDNMISSNQRAKDIAASIKAGDNDSVLPRLTRYRLAGVTIPPSTADKKPEIVTQHAIVDFIATADRSMELPTMNFNYLTKPYRFVYGVVAFNGMKSTFFHGLIKYDLKTRETKTWSEPGQTAGEAIFIPNPHPKSPASSSPIEDKYTRGVTGDTTFSHDDTEDDGVLLTVVLDGNAGSSYLLCLDARTMTELGRAHVNGPVGFGFHGTFTNNFGNSSASTMPGQREKGRLVVGDTVQY